MFNLTYLVITLGNLTSFPNSSSLVRTIINYAVLFLIRVLLHALINATCAETRLLGEPLTFLRWFDTTPFLSQCVHLIHAKVFSIQMLPTFQ